MPQTALGNIGINYEWDLGSDGWKNGLDHNLILLDTLAQAFVVSSTVTAEPGAPSVGDAYVLGSSRTGTNWGSDGGSVEHALAVYTDIAGASSPWTYLTPREGWIVHDRANNFRLLFDGSIWVVDRNFNVRTEPGDFSFANTDLEAVVVDTSASAQNATVPPDSTLTRSRVGSLLRVVAAGAGTISLVAGGGVTLNGLSATSAQDKVLTLVKTAANTWRAFD